MVEVDQMENYQKFNVRIDDNKNLKINDSDELDSISSEDS